MDWRDRFRAGLVVSARTARHNRRRGVAITDRDGNEEAYAWEVDSGTLRRVTDTGTAVLEATISPDGASVIYLRDETGSELGHLHTVPFEGGAPLDLTPDLPRYAAYHIRTNETATIALAARIDEQHLLCLSDGRIELWPQQAMVFDALLADDGSFVAIGEPMRGLYGRTVVRSMHDGAELARLDWSVPGAIHGGSVAVGLHRDGRLRPAIWTPGSEPDALAVDVPGDVVPTDWSEDGSTLLLKQSHDSRGALFLYEVATQAVSALHAPAGAPAQWDRPYLLGNSEAAVIWSDAHRPFSSMRVGQGEGSVLLGVSERETYPGTDWREVTYPSTKGARVQAWLLEPSGDGPWPTIVYGHGGPTSVASPVFNPICQAWADHGYAVLSVNYRGSITFGDEYREALTGSVGSVDVDDLVAGRRWLVEAGIAHPKLIMLNGYSYGGYLTLQCMATRPELWAGGIAGAPITDWIVSGEDQNAMLDAYDRALFGADRADGHAARVKASPRTYVDRFAAPLLISAPEHDTRTPLRPVRLFVDEMRAAGKEIQLHILAGGHAGVGAEQQISMMETWLDFADGIVTRRPI